MLNFAYINLKNLVYNAKNIKRLLGKEKFCAVVKADAYGHGAEKVAAALYAYADCYAVALTEEGVSLRLSGIDKDILVFNTVSREDVEIAVRYNLILTVANISTAKTVYSVAKDKKRRARVHIKVDTGMHRTGFTVNALDNVLRYFSDKRDAVNVEGLYTHLANPEDDTSVKMATALFLLAKDKVKSYNYKVISHISASGGALKGVKSDMARIGIMLYGYKPFYSDKIRLKPVMKVVAPVIARNTLKTGESALYGNLAAKEPTDLTLIRYGYADGLFRREKNGQFNNRCMDITAVKIRTGGKFYTVMDNADKTAKEYGTISYEILVSAATRAEKIYIK